MIDKPVDLTGMEAGDLPSLNEIIRSICDKALGVKNIVDAPSLSNVSEGELVIQDDGAGTKTASVVTGEGNLFTINSGSNFVNLGSIPAGAGVIPAANLPAAAATTVWSILDYGTSASSSTERGTAGSTLKMAFGIFPMTGVSSQAITNLAFTSSISFTAIACRNGSGGYASQTVCASRDSGSQITLRDFTTDSPINWFAVGI